MIDHSRLHLIGAVLLVVLLTPIAVHALLPITGAGESYVVMSGSMEPAIQKGEVIYVLDTPAKSIEEGDVITFRTAPNQPTTTHRVVERRMIDGELAFATKGDANQNRDATPIRPDDVVGEVVFHIPLYGYLIRFAGSRLGALLFIVVPSVLFGLNEAWKLYRALEADGNHE